MSQVMLTGLVRFLNTEIIYIILGMNVKAASTYIHKTHAWSLNIQPKDGQQRHIAIAYYIAC